MEQALEGFAVLKERRQAPACAVAKQRRIGEANRRIVHRVEDKLIKSGQFSLPGKKALTSTNLQWEVVIVDVGESPIERPKKNSAVITAEKRKDIR